MISLGERNPSGAEKTAESMVDRTIQLSRQVSRPRLVDRMRKAPRDQTVLLLAPAGFSKTSCLTEWAATDERPFAIISCTARLDDPAVLVEAIMTELDQLITVDDEVLEALTTLKPAMKTVLARLRRSLASIEQPFVLAFDDVHELTTPATLEVVSYLTEVMPAKGQMAIASRSKPPLPLARMRTHGEVVEIRAEDLAMTHGESRMLLRRLGVEPDPAGLDALHERTEGWPAGLHLAGMALSGESDLTAAIADFAGDDRAVAEYLREELISNLRPTEREFMIRASVLDELSGRICDAALARTGSASMLRELSHGNSLIVPLDRKDKRYRFHHLLQEMLYSELRHREPEIEPEIHTRAGRWYAEHGDFDRAIEHAIAAGDTDEAGELIWSAFPEVSGSGRLATLNRWLSAIGKDGNATSAHLALTSAHRYIAQGEGESAARWATIARAAAAAADPISDTMRADLLVLDATMGVGGVVALGEAAGRASELLTADNPWQVACNFYRGVSAYLIGQPDRARPLLKDAARGGAVVSPPIQALALAQLCQIEAMEAEWETAFAAISQAREKVISCNLTDWPAMAMVYSGAALVHATAGRISKANSELDHCRSLVELLSDYPSWYETEVRVQLCRACLRLDDLEGAQIQLEMATRLMATMPEAPLLGQLVAESASMLDVCSTERIDSTLSNAELRTLQYLPSHLPFSRIGEEMVLSPNTVKSHARKIYQKLGASTRTEAVERARELGLLNASGDGVIGGGPTKGAIDDLAS